MDLRQLQTRVRTFVLVNASDHIAGASSATVLVAQISKNGGSFTSPPAAIQSLGFGWYSLALTTSDTATLGDLAWHITASGADPQDWSDQIVAATVTAGTVLDKSGYAIAGTVTAGTVLDKTGYSLTQSFPANFAALGIAAGGALSQSVTTGTVLDKTNYTGHMTADSVLGAPTVNVTQWNSGAVTSNSKLGVPVVDVGYFGGTSLQLDGHSYPKVDVEAWRGNAIAASNISGVPVVDLVDIGGVALSTATAQLGVATITNADKSGYATTSNIKKNQALSNFMFVMTDSTNHNPQTGLSVALSVAQDGGAFAALSASSATEIAFGVYKLSASQAEMNANNVMIRAIATGSDDRQIEITTTP